jgi:hypothetical protein
MSSQAALIIDRLRRGKCGAMAVTWGRTEVRRLSHVNNLPGLRSRSYDRYQQDSDDA